MTDDRQSLATSHPQETFPLSGEGPPRRRAREKSPHPYPPEKEATPPPVMEATWTMVNRIMAQRQVSQNISISYTRSTDIANIVRYAGLGYIVIVHKKPIPWSEIPSQYHSFVFSKDETAYCPLDHERVPRHRLATQDEIEKLPRGKLPILRTYDIIARWMGFCKGDIVAIERKSSVYYRQVS